jgi:hypothetical protein
MDLADGEEVKRNIHPYILTEAEKLGLKEVPLKLRE